MRTMPASTARLSSVGSIATVLTMSAATGIQALAGIDRRDRTEAVHPLILIVPPSKLRT
jgi:hypothetical protein